MELIKKIIKKLLVFLKNRNQKLLGASQEVEKDNDLQLELINEENEDEIIEEISSYDSIGIDYSNRKKDFFETYKKFKEGKIKRENLIVTDLIDYEIMMMQEEFMLNKKISNQNECIEKQKETIKKLNTKMKSLDKILDNFQDE